MKTRRKPLTKIQKSARGETCTFRLFGSCDNNPETVVLCHASHPDKGMGHKGPDTWAAYGCFACHTVMDNKGHVAWNTYLDSEQYEKYWFEAIRETQRRLIKKGLMP